MEYQRGGRESSYNIRVIVWARPTKYTHDFSPCTVGLNRLILKWIQKHFSSEILVRHMVWQIYWWVRYGISLLKP